MPKRETDRLLAWLMTNCCVTGGRAFILLHKLGQVHAVDVLFFAFMSFDLPSCLCRNKETRALAKHFWVYDSLDIRAPLRGVTTTVSFGCWDAPAVSGVELGLHTLSVSRFELQLATSDDVLRLLLGGILEFGAARLLATVFGGLGTVKSVGTAECIRDDRVLFINCDSSKCSAHSR